MTNVLSPSLRAFSLFFTTASLSSCGCVSICVVILLVLDEEQKSLFIILSLLTLLFFSLLFFFFVSFFGMRVVDTYSLRLFILAYCLTFIHPYHTQKRKDRKPNRRKKGLPLKRKPTTNLLCSRQISADFLSTFIYTRI